MLRILKLVPEELKALSEELTLMDGLASRVIKAAEETAELSGALSKIAFASSRLRPVKKYEKDRFLKELCDVLFTIQPIVNELLKDKTNLERIPHIFQEIKDKIEAGI